MLNINGLNMSAWVNRKRHTVSVVTVEGTGGGTLRNGVRVRDIRATKDVLTYTMNPLSEEQYRALDQRRREEHVAVRCSDFGADVVKEMKAMLNQANVQRLGGVDYWTDLTLTLEEM